MINAIILDGLTGEVVDKAGWLDRLSPRNVWTGILADTSSDWFEVAINVLTSDSYLYLGTAFPDRNQLISTVSPTLNGIPPRVQMDGVINAQPGALLVSITTTSLQPDGVAVRVYDKQAGYDLFHGQFAFANAVSEYQGIVDNTLPAVDTAIGGVYPGQYFLPTPYVVGGKGQINISVTNMSTLYNIAQVYLVFAIPAINSKSTDGILLEKLGAKQHA